MHHPKRIQVSDVKEGDWVKVICEGEWFLEKVVKTVENSCLIHCLEKPYGISEPQDLESERDTVVYEELYDVDGIIPQQIKVKRSWK